MLSGSILVISFLFHVYEQIYFELVNDLLRCWNLLSFHDPFLILYIAVLNLYLESFVHMIGWVITGENLQFILICLLLVVLKSKVTHCYHPFLFDKNLPWLLLWFVENVVA